MTDVNENRIIALDKEMRQFMQKSERNDIGVSKDIEYIKKDLMEIKKMISDHYVTRTEFEPIKKIVYGLIALTLTGVVTAVLALVVKG